MGCVDGCALRLCHYRERRLLVLQGDIVCKSTEKGGYSVPERFSSNVVTGKRYETLLDLAKQKNVAPSALVVAWLVNLRRMPDCPCVIPLFSSSKTTHFLENLAGCEISLSDEEMKILTEA